jgi:hypothetical protein
VPLESLGFADCVVELAGLEPPTSLSDMRRSELGWADSAYSREYSRYCVFHKSLKTKLFLSGQLPREKKHHTNWKAALRICPH